MQMNYIRITFDAFLRSANDKAKSTIV